MAAEAQKPKEGDKQEPKKKKGLGPIIFVVVGAALGGAGVALLAPKPKPVEHKREKEPELVHVQCADKMEFTFNPKVERGRMTAVVSFYFVVRHRDDKKDEEHVNRLIKDNWERGRSRVLEVLMSQSAAELQAPDGKKHLRKQICDELTVTFFISGEALVDDVYWDKFFVQ